MTPFFSGRIVVVLRGMTLFQVAGLTIFINNTSPGELCGINVSHLFRMCQLLKRPLRKTSRKAWSL